MLVIILLILRVHQFILNLTQHYHLMQTIMPISELDLDTIFDNLITNSIEAFQRNGVKGERKISIKLEIESKNIKVPQKVLKNLVCLEELFKIKSSTVLLLNS
mgnify:CR=1 FL=1